MIYVAIVLSVLIGLSLGLLGGGGSILTLPILVYVLAVPPRDAIALSLLVVAVTSLAALVPHAAAGRVQLRTALAFGGSGMLAAYGAGHVARYIPANVLLIAFALVMIATAAAMLRDRRAASEPPAPSLIRLVALGGAVGAVSGLIGAGGGFLIVPALVLFAGLTMHHAVGTSLVVIAMNSLAGFLGHLGHAHLDARLAAIITAGAVAGSIIGGRLASRVPQATLRRAFGWLVLAMGIYMFIRQL